MKNKFLLISLIAFLTVSSYFAGNAANIKEVYAAPASSYIGHNLSGIVALSSLGLLPPT